MAGSPLLLSSLPPSYCASVPPGHQSDKSARLIDPISFVLCTYFRRERSCLLLDRGGRGGEGEGGGGGKGRERRGTRRSVLRLSVLPRICMHAASSAGWRRRWAGRREREGERGEVRGREGERRRKIGLFVSDLRIWHEKSERRPNYPAGGRAREGQALGIPEAGLESTNEYPLF